LSFFSDQIALGLTDILDAAGQSVTYYRGDDSITVTAVPGDGQRRGLQTEVVRINSQRDWLILVEALTFGVPLRGDQIVYNGVTWEVLPQDGEDCYRAVGFVQYRIHTKVIAIE